jgi:ferredoxin
VTVAVGHGKRAARHIDAWLRGGAYDKPPKHPVVDFAMLNLPIYADAVPSTQRELAPEERVGGFDEVLAGLSEQEAIHEAKRCLSCGNCFECDNCYAACPEDAIIKLGLIARTRGKDNGRSDDNGREHGGRPCCLPCQ